MPATSSWASYSESTWRPPLTGAADASAEVQVLTLQVAVAEAERRDVAERHARADHHVPDERVVVGVDLERVGLVVRVDLDQAVADAEPEVGDHADPRSRTPRRRWRARGASRSCPCRRSRRRDEADRIDLVLAVADVDLGPEVLEEPRADRAADVEAGLGLDAAREADRVGAGQVLVRHQAVSPALYST
jgi:hypothetical protein